MQASVQIRIGTELFAATLRRELAPHSCARLVELLPYRGKILHACWSGEALWSPLTAVWPRRSILPPENAIANPAPGQVLLFGGETSEPELLFAYGPCRFASRAGPLAGNPVLTIENLSPRFAELGHEILWRGAADLCIELTDKRSDLCQTGECKHAGR